MGPLDLQCLTMIWAMCVVEDVSIFMQILTSDVRTILERPLFLLETIPIWSKLIVRRRLVLHNLVISQKRPSLLQPSFGKLTILVR